MHRLLPVPFFLLNTTTLLGFAKLGIRWLVQARRKVEARRDALVNGEKHPFLSQLAWSILET